MSTLIVAATYLVVAAFYLRLALHALSWLEAARRSPAGRSRSLSTAARSVAGASVDVVFLRRLLAVNPALWVGEWVFHAALFAVVLRHLRYFMNPVPAWVLWAQTPGWIAGFLLPAALLAVLAVRLTAPHRHFSSRANLLTLLNLLGIAATGLLMSTRCRVDLAGVKASRSASSRSPRRRPPGRAVHRAPGPGAGARPVRPEPRLHRALDAARRPSASDRAPAGAA